VSEGKEARPHAAARLVYATIGGSLLVSVALVLVHVRSGSQLALAQAADSFSDMLSGLALVWAVRHSARPPDEDHPLGHTPAEPIAALMVAVLAGVLAVEVARTAAMALALGATPELDWAVAAVFFAKVAFKATIATLAWRERRAHRHPTLDALMVDARNDVLVGLVALLGFALARFGLPVLDGWLAIAVALYVAYAAVRLGSENVRLLMGTAAPVEQQEALLERARSTEGVRGVDELVATWAGTGLHVHCAIVVDPELSLRAAHDIGHRVEERLMEVDDVARAIVHVGPQE
jgi:cation diffusion facilitator family transporter